MHSSSPAAPELTVALIDEFRMVTDGLAAHLTDTGSGIRVTIRARSWPELTGHPDFPAAVTVLDPALRDGMPLTNRVQLLREAGSAVVVMSRHADAASAARALRAGALGFVPKTEGADALLSAIRDAAAGRRHLPEALATAAEHWKETELPSLGKREQRALSLYAAGYSARQVATEMRTTEETIKSYVKRARKKYREAGIDLGTRLRLRRHGIREGWIEPD